jgi:transposase-like protein
MASRKQVWVPPFCPNPGCDSHTESTPWRFKKKGFYERQARPRRIQRYRCQRCRRNFSSQTFSTTYWLRLPQLLRPLFFRILACSAYRQIAQEFGTSHTTIQHQVERLGRHCLLFHEALRPAFPAEPLVLDGFRTVESGRYWPFDMQLVVGVSHYVYGFNEAELRRSGTMTRQQRRKRERLEERLGRPARQATRQAVAELVARVVPPKHPVAIHSDDHRAYPAAFRRLPDHRLAHKTTSSRAARTARNPLFPVNLADLLLRHTGANHKRKTIAFSKRRQGACYRAAIWAVWRNYVKSTSERRRTAPPGVKLGLVKERLSVDDVIAQREFPFRHRERLTGWLEQCYFARIPTRAIARCREHELRYAV